MKRRVAGAAVGLVYGIFYGFWTMLLTGGGHGNFSWFLLFFTAQFFGLFFPLVGLFAADLRPFWAQNGFWIVMSASLMITLIMIPTILVDPEHNDLVKSWHRHQLGFVFFTVIHLLPYIGLILFFFVQKHANRPIDL